MKIAIGTDHGGFDLKEFIIDVCKSSGVEVVDMGANDGASSDFPDYAKLVCEAIQEKDVDRGILLCGSGVGMAVTANKFKGIIACLCHDTYSARQGVQHDQMNVLCLGARIIGPELAGELVRSFLGAKFEGVERHCRRLEKIRDIENRQLT